MRRAVKVLILTAAAALALSPVQARAEGYISPWVAANAGTGFNGNNLGRSFDNGRAGIGTQVGAMGKGIIGAELDFGWSPSFFGTTNDFGSNSVIDVMGNIIVGIPIGGTHGAGIRPYVTAGLGLLRTQIDGGTVATVSSSNNDLGWNAGAGVDGVFLRSLRPARRRAVSAEHPEQQHGQQHRLRSGQLPLLESLDRRRHSVRTLSGLGARG